MSMICQILSSLTLGINYKYALHTKFRMKCGVGYLAITIGCENSVAYETLEESIAPLAQVLKFGSIPIRFHLSLYL